MQEKEKQRYWINSRHYRIKNIKQEDKRNVTQMYDKYLKVIIALICSISTVLVMSYFAIRQDLGGLIFVSISFYTTLLVGKYSVQPKRTKKVNVKKRGQVNICYTYILARTLSWFCFYLMFFAFLVNINLALLLGCYSVLAEKIYEGKW